MHYFQTITNQFRGEKWGENLLLVSVCMLIPFIGPLLLIGYCTYGIVATQGQPLAPWPRFDFNRFTEYLYTGAWPFLVSLVVMFLMMPLFFLPMAPIFLVIPAAEQDPDMAFLGIALTIVICLALFVVLMVILSVVTTPMILRSALEQNFNSAFNLRFIRSFIKRVWKELILVQLFIGLIGTALMLIGYMMCFVGFYPAAAIVTVAGWNLMAQLYSLYLERGGDPIAIPEKLLSAALEKPGDPTLPPKLPSAS